MPDRRQYLFSSAQVRLAVALGTVGMIAIIVVLLLLGTAHPRAEFAPLDGAPFQQHLAAATADLTGFAVDGERARIDIDRAIQLVAERGVQAPGFYVAGAAAPAAPAAEGAEPTAESATGGAAALPDGEALFASTCSACHQASGQGIPGAFPPLAGHAPALYEAERDLPLEIILFGMQGAITVNGMTYNSLMPSHPQLDDAQLAAVANHVMTAWGNDAALTDFQAYTAADAEAVRAKALSMDQVHAARAAAGLD